MAAIVGTAGWSIPAKDAAHFPAEGTSLQRYAERFAGVEINSSFHRPHRASTWAKWAESVPDRFRFSVKMPKTISHQAKLVDCSMLVDTFLEEASGLGDKLAVLLLQLPPKLAFDAALVGDFLEQLKRKTPVQIACEPRNASWFEADADAMLDRLKVARVAADPAVVEQAAVLGGWRGFSYWRLHGSPVMYRSSYADRIGSYATQVRAEVAQGHESWCMFDNTASSAATGDALELIARL
jgi:uncharacterized protein YecE (DUF72 family)